MGQAGRALHVARREAVHPGPVRRRRRREQGLQQVGAASPTADPDQAGPAAQQRGNRRRGNGRSRAPRPVERSDRAAGAIGLPWARAAAEPPDSPGPAQRFVSRPRCADAVALFALRRCRKHRCAGAATIWGRSLRTYWTRVLRQTTDGELTRLFPPHWRIDSGARIFSRASGERAFVGTSSNTESSDATVAADSPRKA